MAADARCCFLAILATLSTPGAAILYTDTCFADAAGGDDGTATTRSCSDVARATTAPTPGPAAGV